MKTLIHPLWFAGAWAVLAQLGAAYHIYAAVNVTQHHKHDSRDGLYIDAAFTQTAAAGLKRDLAFSGSIAGNVYAQPLYIEGGSGGKAMIITVTESDNVYALDAANGAPANSFHCACFDGNAWALTGATPTNAATYAGSGIYMPPEITRRTGTPVVGCATSGASLKCWRTSKRSVVSSAACGTVS